MLRKVHLSCFCFTIMLIKHSSNHKTGSKLVCCSILIFVIPSMLFNGLGLRLKLLDYENLLNKFGYNSWPALKQ